MGRRVGKSPSSVARKERDISGMRVDEVERYASALDVTVAELMGGGAQTEREEALLGLFRRLPAEEQDRVLKIIQALTPTG